METVVLEQACAIQYMHDTCMLAWLFKFLIIITIIIIIIITITIIKIIKAFTQRPAL